MLDQTWEIEQSTTLVNVDVECGSEIKENCINIALRVDVVIKDTYIHGNKEARCINLEPEASLHLSNTGLYSCGGEGIREGGGIFARKGNRIQINCAVFKNSMAIDNGGAISVSTSKTFNVSDANFMYNNAGFAGALHAVFLLSSLNIVNSIFMFNTANDAGGIYISHSDATISGSHIQNNEATGAGGGVMIKYSNLYVNDTEITGNTASIGGAQVDCAGTNYNPSNITIDTSSYNNGQGYYVQGECPVTTF